MCSSASTIQQGACSSQTKSADDDPSRLPHLARHRIPKWQLMRLGDDVLFEEKAIFAANLPEKACTEFSRWTIGLVLLAPLWSYFVSGFADHWWFVARTKDRRFYYVAQFGSAPLKSGKTPLFTNVIEEWLTTSDDEALQWGLLSDRGCGRIERAWKQCEKPRSIIELSELAGKSSVNAKAYRLIDNNCQHFARSLYKSGRISSV